jgi:hypothetical protein
MRTLRQPDTEELTRDDPAHHLAVVARALSEMPEATAISSLQFVEDGEVVAIRQLVPTLAARYGLTADVEYADGALTVTFERPR